MYGRNANTALRTMTDSDNDVIVIATERFERRLAEENGKLRVDMATEFGHARKEMAQGFGGLRVEMLERNHDLLKWLLIFGITQTAAIIGLIKLWR
jgi:hypothetical protein